MKRKILITGASKGIGRAEAERLSADYELFLHASSLSSFKKDIKGAHYFGYDFSKTVRVHKAII